MSNTSSSIDADRGIGGILMVISPAKTLDLNPLAESDFTHGADAAKIAMKTSDECKNMSSYCDETKTELIAQSMKKRNEGELKKLLNLSPNLAKLAHQYWSDFTFPQTNQSNNKLKAAVFAFSGPAFQGISPLTCSPSALTYMAHHLCILDPVYGVLHSMDDIQPYRLEMGCKGVVASAKGKKNESLASFWKDSVTSFLCKELHPEISNTTIDSDSGGKKITPILANLASEEYSSSIDPTSLPSNSIFLNIKFLHQGRIISVHSKRARGLMVRYISESNARTLEDVSGFNLEGYTCLPVDEKNRGAGGSGKKGKTTDGNGLETLSDKKQFWEIVDVVGDNVQIVQMTFDRNGVPKPVSKRSNNEESVSKPKRTNQKSNGGKAKKRRS